MANRLITLALASCLAAPLSAQRASSWATEIGAGAVLDLAARGPWIAPSWRRSPPKRIVLGMGVSLFWEHVVEPWNGYGHAGRFDDDGQRLVGMLLTEVVIAVGRKIL